jgi:hypothetical protein
MDVPIAEMGLLIVTADGAVTLLGGRKTVSPREELAGSASVFCWLKAKVLSMRMPAVMVRRQMH